MNTRTYRIAVLLSVFALVGVAAAGMAAAQTAQGDSIDNVAVSPSPATTQDSVSVDVTVTAGGSGNGGESHRVIVTAEGGPSSPVQSVIGPTTVPDNTQTTVTANLGSLAAGTYTINATLTNETASSSTTNTANSLTVNPDPSQRAVSNTETVFVNERDIDTNAGVFAGLSTGDFEQDGVPLNIDNGVVQDQSTGQYTEGDGADLDGDGTIESVNVQRAQIQSVRVIDLNTGERLDRGDERVESSNSENVQVAVRYNFEESSYIDFGVNEDGLEVTQRYLSASYDTGQGAGNIPAADGRNYDAVFNLTVDDSGQFEIEAAAEDTVNNGRRDVGFADGVSQTLVLEVVDEDNIQLNLEQSNAFQGEEVQYNIEGLNEGERSAVILEGDDLRDQTPTGIVGVGNQVFDPIADGTANGHILQVTDAGATNLAAPVASGDYLVVDGEGADIVPGADNVGVLNNAGNGFAVTTQYSVNTLETVVRNGSVSAEYVFGVVERDGTSQSQIDTKYLDDTGVDLDAFGSSSPPNANVDAVFNIFTSGSGGGSPAQIAENEDEQSITVDEAQIGINSPGRTYVPGQDVDINGTTSDGVDEVSVFVRDRDNYYLVQNISVDDANDEYSEEDFQLGGDRSDAATAEAQDILSKPGVYRYGVIDHFDSNIAQRASGTGAGARDVYATQTNNNENGLTSSEFNEGASTQQSIRVAEPSLEADFNTYNGEVYRPDGIDYNGTLIGPREYVVLFTGSRGNTIGTTDQADRDGNIDEDFDLAEVRSGTVTAALLSPGRDGLFGDGTFDTAGINSPANPGVLISLLNSGDNTQSQARELLLSETVQEASSDDLISTEEFRLSTDSRTQIEDVVPEQLSENATGITGIEVGETMVIRGITNRNPEDATIVVEAVDGPSTAELGTAVTDSWGEDGVWSVSIEVPESVEPGQYTIQSDDGARISEANVTIAASGTYEEGERAGNQLGELQNQIEELQNQVDQLESERDDLQQQVSDLESENSDLQSQLEEAQNQSNTGGDEQTNETDDGEGQPGFTAVAALISLIAVALLAIRRQEE